MKKILLFGAGKSATALIDYLLQHALAENWMLTVVDSDPALVQSKLGNALGGTGLSFDINNESERRFHISEADIVISLLPPALHFIVAKDCVEFSKDLLTASYVDDNMRSLENDIRAKGLCFLSEMGLDPGIDHMSAKKMIDAIHDQGGRITSFYSHCGGLVAPESDDNPWHYKISWNPRNVVVAGKAGAIFRKNGEKIEWDYKKLFEERRYIKSLDGEPLCWYPNRDSISYAHVYELDQCPTIIRTTLRHPDFIYGWKNIIELQLTNEEKVYQTDGKTLMAFFKEHFSRNGFSDWLQNKMQEQFQYSKKILEDLVNLVELEGKAQESGSDPLEGFMMVTDKGSLENVDLDELKTNAAATVAARMHDAKLTLRQLFFLGMDDNETMINKGLCSAADVLQFALERKLMLQPSDKDLVVMHHEIEYTLDAQHFRHTATLSCKGQDARNTAMAKTVGLPLGIAARLILNGTINLVGLHIPVHPDIYRPVLEELAAYGIKFRETNEAVIKE